MLHDVSLRAPIRPPSREGDGGEIGIRLEGVDQMVLGRPFRPLGDADPGMMHIRAAITLLIGIGNLF